MLRIIPNKLHLSSGCVEVAAWIVVANDWAGSCPLVVESALWRPPADEPGRLVDTDGIGAVEKVTVGGHVLENTSTFIPILYRTKAYLRYHFLCVS